LGQSDMHKLLIELVGGWINPTFLIGVLSYFPLLNKMRDNIVAMGVNEERLYQAMRRFQSVGERSAFARRLPMYRIVSWQSRKVIDRGSKYHWLADSLVKVTSVIPMSLVQNTPTWSQELTYEPVA
ncbi:MAG TPA: ferritin-like domain-containing protein, partial [Mycobacterium sp.]|nr:ferritin-like domain-containing protein [Mycobacterium sp.]